MASLTFAGRHALVTGGKKGIGLAIADRLRLEGCTVTAPGHEELDVRFEEDVKHFVALHGPFDILINNAGIFGPVKSMLNYTRDEWNDVLEVNLTGQWIVAKVLAPDMVARGYGRIVNISSAVGKDVNPMAPVYSIAKAGVIALTKCLGRELAKTGVTVNCVTPAACQTDLFKNTPDEQIQVMLKKMPMERFITVREVASMVCWIASDECSGTTASAFDISGGRCQY